MNSEPNNEMIASIAADAAVARADAVQAHIRWLRADDNARELEALAKGLSDYLAETTDRE